MDEAVCRPQLCSVPSRSSTVGRDVWSSSVVAGVVSVCVALLQAAHKASARASGASARLTSTTTPTTRGGHRRRAAASASSRRCASCGRTGAISGSPGRSTGGRAASSTCRPLAGGTGVRAAASAAAAAAAAAAAGCCSRRAPSACAATATSRTGRRR